MEVIILFTAGLETDKGRLDLYNKEQRFTKYALISLSGPIKRK